MPGLSPSRRRSSEHFPQGPHKGVMLLQIRVNQSLQKFVAVHSSVYNHFNLRGRTSLLTGRFQARTRRRTAKSRQPEAA